MPLDQILVTGERHLRLVLGEYLGHYNTHRTLQQNSPAGRASACGSDRYARSAPDRLGLIREYAQAAKGDTVSGTTGLSGAGRLVHRVAL